MDFLQELQSLGIMVLVTSQLPLNLHPSEGPPLCLGPLPPPVRPPSLCSPQHKIWCQELALASSCCLVGGSGGIPVFRDAHRSLAPAEPGPLDVCSAASPLCIMSHTHGAHKFLIFPSCLAGKT